MNDTMRNKGFTLIELLTVIAIIAILAAIIFPVFARAKDSANKGSDMSNMNSLRTALQLYRIDQGGYPPALFGYVNTYSGDPNGSDVMPVGEATGFLFPKRVADWKTFQPAYNRFSRTATTFAQWPSKDQRAVGTAPQVDLNGDGQIDANDDPAGARQKYGLEQNGFVRRDGEVTNNPNEAARFYKVDGYDVTEVKMPDGSNQLRPELRYARFWTVWGLGSGNVNDDPRQLGYAEPLDDAVVTWNSFFREVNQAGVASAIKRDMVLFVGGGVRNMDSRNVQVNSWRQPRQ
jgi:prepilin-type N-terminal cleavage/methylation domain-containing protein